MRGSFLLLFVLLALLTTCTRAQTPPSQQQQQEEESLVTKAQQFVQRARESDMAQQLRESLSSGIQQAYQYFGKLADMVLERTKATA